MNFLHKSFIVGIISPENVPVRNKHDGVSK